MIGIHETKQHNWRCDYCPHISWKTAAGAMGHVEREHPKDLEISRKDAEIERLKNRPPKVEVRERVVYKEKPKPKYWYIENGGGIYCETCKVVEMRVGIPEGQTIENTPHSCGNRTLRLVLEVR